MTTNLCPWPGLMLEKFLPKVSLLATLALAAGCAGDDGAPKMQDPLLVAADANNAAALPGDPALGNNAVSPPSAEGINEELPGSLTDDPFAVPSQNDVAPNPGASESYAEQFQAPDSTGSEASFDSAAAGASDGGKAVTRYVKGIQLNVRAQPSAKAAIVRRLDGGSKITCTIQGAYCRIKKGEFVRTTYLSATPTKKVSQKDVDAAWKKGRAGGGKAKGNNKKK